MSPLQLPKMDSCVLAILFGVPLNQMDPRIHSRIEMRLEEIELELNSEDTSALIAETLYDERDELLRMVDRSDTAWNALTLFDPEDNPSWPAPVTRLDRDGDPVVTLPCTDCGLVGETTEGMGGACADCFWESTKRQRRSCGACGGRLSFVAGTTLICGLCRDVDAEEDTRGCGNCAGCAYCMASPDFVPADEV
jgi:hypothetical protein